jgi:hypothetical protein
MYRKILIANVLICGFTSATEFFNKTQGAQTMKKSIRRSKTLRTLAFAVLSLSVFAGAQDQFKTGNTWTYFSPGHLGSAMCPGGIYDTSFQRISIISSRTINGSANFTAVIKDSSWAASLSCPIPLSLTIDTCNCASDGSTLSIQNCVKGDTTMARGVVSHLLIPKIDTVDTIIGYCNIQNVILPVLSTKEQFNNYPNDSRISGNVFGFSFYVSSVGLVLYDVWGSYGPHSGFGTFYNLISFKGDSFNGQHLIDSLKKASSVSWIGNSAGSVSLHAVSFIQEGNHLLVAVHRATKENLVLHLIGLNGRSVRTFIMPSNGVSRFSLDLSGLSAGVYYAAIEFGRNSMQAPFRIIKRG